MVWVSARNEALKLLLESNITSDLKDYDMNNRIADVIEGVIKKYTLLEQDRDNCLKREQVAIDKLQDIGYVLRGLKAVDWEN